MKNFNVTITFELTDSDRSLEGDAMDLIYTAAGGRIILPVTVPVDGDGDPVFGRSMEETLESVVVDDIVKAFDVIPVLERRLASAVEVVKWYDGELRGIVDLADTPNVCPYCGEDDYGIGPDSDEFEPCGSCAGQAECRWGEGFGCVWGCPACLGCDEPRQRPPHPPKLRELHRPGVETPESEY